MKATPLTIATSLLIYTSFATSLMGEDKKPGKQTDNPADKEAVTTDKKTEAADSKTVTTSDEGARRPALVARIVLKVVNPTEAQAAVKEEAESLGGFMSFVDNASISVKVPPKELSKLLKSVSEKGIVVDKNLERNDLTQSIAELKGRLKSKQEILSRMRTFFNDSDVQATLAIEQTLTGLVMEIEQVRGALRVLGDRADWAVLDISFQFRERDRVVYVSSPFEWLNTASLDHFLEEF
jgi:hypothetical protein